MPLTEEEKEKIKEEEKYREGAREKAGAEAKKKPLLKQRVGCGTVVFLFIVIFIIIAIVSSGGDNKSTQPIGPTKVEAMTMGQMFLEERLKAPSTADYPWVSSDDVVEALGENKFRYKSYVDAENSFGAKVRTYFDITVQYVGDDKWELISIDTW